jgi:signal transduction histidine kinase
MLFTTRTKITFLFTLIVMAIIGLLDIIIFQSADHAWQQNKKDYATKVMQAMYTPEQAKKELSHVEIRNNSWEVIHRQWVFLENLDSSADLWFWSFLRTDTLESQGKSYIVVSEPKWDLTITTAEEVTSEIAMRDDTIHRALWISLAGILLTGVIGYAFSGYILRPIRSLHLSAERFSLEKKDMTHHTGIVWHAWDEVVLLARSLESLFSRVKSEASRLEQFSDDIAHEIKNTLFSIESSLDVALHTEHRELGIEKAKNMLVELSRVVDALLFFSRGGEGNMTETNIYDLISSHIDHTDHRITLEWDAHIVESIYPELFMTAIGNIISNAEKFTPADGKIDIIISKTGIEIRDTGVGIASADLPRIFDRLWKWDRARASGTGYGLGLAITRKVIEDLHHFQLSVMSVEGEGTTFRIVWKDY